jgi:uncharacterized protein (UPF0147 family)
MDADEEKLLILLADKKMSLNDRESCIDILETLLTTEALDLLTSISRDGEEPKQLRIRANKAKKVLQMNQND